MASMSDYLEKKLLDHVLRATSFAAPSAVYLGIFTAAPSDSGGGTEVSGNAYVRKSITFAAAHATDGTIKNSADVIFPNAAPLGWGTVTHFGIFDAETAGNLLIHGALTASKTINGGDRIQFAINDIVVTFA